MATWPIPPAFLPDLQQVHFASGVPMSWLATVCDLAGWNPYYEQLNVFPNGGTSIRRFGIAGIWAEVPQWSYHIVPPT